MKYTGMCRPVDELGRVVIPKEIRKTLNIEVKDSLDIFVEGNAIVMQKREKQCAVCGASEGLLECDGKHICTECIKKIKSL